MRIGVRFAGLMLAGLVAACGGGDGGEAKVPTTGAASGSGPTDACALVTAQEVGVVAAATVGEGKQDATAFPGPDCQWEWDGGQRNAVLLVQDLGNRSPHAWVDSARSNSERIDQSGKVKIGDGIEVDAVPPEKRTTFVELAGLGDAAWAEQLGDGTVQQLAAAIAGAKSAIQITFLRPVSKDGAVDLLKKAVERVVG